MEYALHQVFEPPLSTGETGDSEGTKAQMSVWLCIGPFPDEHWHAEDHPNAICFCKRAPLEIAESVASGVQRLLRKLSIDYSVERYPGD